MSTDNIKEQLIQATVKLLKENNEISKITARQIVSAAGTTLGMIKYYFDSKDALVNEAVNRLIADRAVQLQEIQSKDIPATEKLIEFLTNVSDTMVEYQQYTKPTIPYCLLNVELNDPYYILPLVKECFPSKTETECRIIAYQLVSFPQLVFYRSVDFQKYTGINVDSKEERDRFLRLLVEPLILTNLKE